MSVADLTKTSIETPPVEPTVTVIEPRPGWQPVDLAELWKYRELVYFLTWRDIKVRYKQTVLGAAWAIIQPVMTMIIFTILFGEMGGMSEGVENYSVLVYAAILPWQFFSSAVTQSSQSLVASANLVSKVYFPRLIVPIAAVGAGLVDFAISFCVFLLLLAIFALSPSPMIVLMPLFLVAVIVTAIGVGSLLSALTVTYRDFRYVVPFLVQMWMFASPVGYPMSRVSEYLANRNLSPDWILVYCLNPMAGIVGGFRWALLGEPLDFRCLAISLAVSLTLLIIGAFYFRRTERRIADIV